MHACMRDGVLWFALMPVRKEQQSASSGIRCCFSFLVNTLSVLALNPLPSSLPPLGGCIKKLFLSPSLLFYCFASCYTKQ